MPDLFISYAHVDKHWVDAFVPLLEQRVNQQAGRAKPDRIWKDNRFSSNLAITPEIDAQLAQTQCLVSILSPGYLASEWCMYELNQFSARVGANSGRIFCVEPDHIPLDRKPLILTAALGSQFWRQDPLSKRTYPLNPDEREFDDRLYDLAKDIVACLYPPVGASHAGESLAGQAPTALINNGAGVSSAVSSLEKRYALLQELLARQQEELTFADDPKRQMRLERDIRVTQASLGQVEAELSRYQSRPTGL